MIKKILSILSILALLLVLFACSSTQEQATPKPVASVNTEDKVLCAQDVKECPDGSFVGRDATNSCQFSKCPEQALSLDPKIVEMKSKAGGVQSYEYLDSSNNLIVLVKGAKKALITSDPNKFSGDFKVNTIFLDSSSNTAYAACLIESGTRDTFACNKDVDKYTDATYSDFDVVDPYSYLLSLTNGKVVGEENCESRKCDIIEYTKDSSTFKMWVRRIYFMPYKISKIDSEGKEQQVVMYSNAAFDHLKESDVTLPSTLKKV